MLFFNLNPEINIRPESRGALLFNPKNAETVYIDREDLSFLRDLLKGNISGGKIPASLILELQRTQILVQANNKLQASLTDIENCLDTKIEETPNSLSVPETLHIALTNICDQVCEGCFYSKGANSPEIFISTQLFEKILNDSFKHRVFQFAFGGGEPLLHSDIISFVKKSSKKNIVPNITTNGNLITKELAFELKKAGLGQIQISLNASTPELNAHTRPNFRKAIKAMEICKKVGLRFGINTLVTRDNYKQLPPLFALAKKTDAQGVNLLRPKPPVNSSGWLQRVSLNSSENRELHQLLIQENKKYKISITLDQSLSFLAYHREAEELYYNGVWGCGAGRRFLTINPDGIVYPCSHLREPIGKNGNFINSWKTSTLLEQFRNLEKTIKTSCSQCKLVSVCRGCRAVVKELGGDFLDSDPHCPLNPPENGASNR